MGDAMFRFGTPKLRRSEVCPHRCALAGGSVLAPPARGHLSENNIPEQVLQVLEHLRRQGARTRARERPPERRLSGADHAHALAGHLAGAHGGDLAYIDIHIYIYICIFIFIYI
jgi:hypothetical protein